MAVGDAGAVRVGQAAVAPVKTLVTYADGDDRWWVVSAGAGTVSRWEVQAGPGSATVMGAGEKQRGVPVLPVPAQVSEHPVQHRRTRPGTSVGSEQSHPLRVRQPLRLGKQRDGLGAGHDCHCAEYHRARNRDFTAARHRPCDGIRPGDRRPPLTMDSRWMRGLTPTDCGYEIASTLLVGRRPRAFVHQRPVLAGGGEQIGSSWSL